MHSHKSEVGNPLPHHEWGGVVSTMAQQAHTSSTLLTATTIMKTMQGRTMRQCIGMKRHHITLHALSTIITTFSCPPSHATLLIINLSILYLSSATYPHLTHHKLFNVLHQFNLLSEGRKLIKHSSFPLHTGTTKWESENWDHLSPQDQGEQIMVNKCFDCLPQHVNKDQ